MDEPQYSYWLRHDDGWDVEAPIGSFRANPFGIHDVLGNAREWTSESPLPYTHPMRAGDGRRSPPPVGGSESVIVRGGRSSSGIDDARVSARHEWNAMYRAGMRPVRFIER